MSKDTRLKPFVVAPDEGRAYAVGQMSAVFKADMEQTNSTLSVSEWWLDPHAQGPHLHDHPETHLFYMLEGRMAFYLEERGWFEAEQGAYIYIPGGTPHGFENRSEHRAGFISINTPGGFEEMFLT